MANKSPTECPSDHTRRQLLPAKTAQPTAAGGLQERGGAEPVATCWQGSPPPEPGRSPRPSPVLRPCSRGCGRSRASDCLSPARGTPPGVLSAPPGRPTDQGGRL